MTIDRRLLLAAALPAVLLFVAPTLAQAEQSWNGTWIGVQGKRHAAPIKLAIVDGKVVSYSLEGSSFDIQYSDVTPTTVSFGDHDHYFVKLKRTGDATASGKVHGRLGTGVVSLTRQ
jgi:hypothetical protein